MFGTATKYFAGVGLLLIVAATVYGVGTAANGSGDVAFSGTIILGTIGTACLFLAWLSLEAGDSPSIDREREAAYELVPAYWPIMASAGVGVLIVGLVANPFLAFVGFVLVVLAAIEWTITAWADRRSTDAAANYAVRRKTMLPFEVPVYAVVFGAIPVLLLSRVFLALPKNGSSWLALGASTVILIFAFLFYAKPDLKGPIMASILAVGALAVVVGGIVAIAVGERDFHHHDEDKDHSEETEDHEESTLGSLGEVAQMVVSVR